MEGAAARAMVGIDSPPPSLSLRSLDTSPVSHSLTVEEPFNRLLTHGALAEWGRGTALRGGGGCRIRFACEKTPFY
jgi:hypothetical protein